MAYDVVPDDDYIRVGSPKEVSFAPAVIDVTVVSTATKVLARAALIGWDEWHVPVFLSPGGRVCKLPAWDVDAVERFL